MGTANSVKLPPNATFSYRMATLVRVINNPVIGVIEIREGRSPKAKATVSRYAIREESLADSTDRVFKLTKPEGAESYYVCLAADASRFNQCECKGYESKGTCKHLEALETFSKEGHLKIQKPAK